MKIYILTDLEGVAMVSRWSQIQGERRDVSLQAKAQAMKLLTWEVNAAVDGILDANSSAEIIIWDGHGSGGIDPMEFHPKAKLIAKGPIEPPYCLDQSFDGLFFVGQHAMAGTPEGVLCHTYSSKCVEYYRLNKIYVGEFGARAAMAGAFDVPTVFLSGDDKAVAEAKALVPGIHGAVVKIGLKQELAIHLSPKASHALIREKARKACEDLDSIPPVKFDPPFELEIKFHPNQKISQFFFRRNAEKIDDGAFIYRSYDICELPI